MRRRRPVWVPDVAESLGIPANGRADLIVGDQLRTIRLPIISLKHRTSIVWRCTRASWAALLQCRTALLSYATQENEWWPRDLVEDEGGENAPVMARRFVYLYGHLRDAWEHRATVAQQSPGLMDSPTGRYPL